MFSYILLSVVLCLVRSNTLEDSYEYNDNDEILYGDDQYYSSITDNADNTDDTYDTDETQELTETSEDNDNTDDTDYTYDDALAEYNEFQDDNAWPMSKRCDMSGDPHTWTFDRAYHHAQALMKPGWFWAVTGCRHRYIPFGFQVYYVPIARGHWISVTRGFRAILTKGVTIETTHSQRGYSVNGKTVGNGVKRYNVKGNEITSIPSKGRAIYVKSHNHQIWVKIYQSGQVIATGEYWNGWAAFRVAQFYKSANGKLCGLCGAYNGHPGRDFQLCDGKIINSGSISHWQSAAGRKKLECFSESWQVGVKCSPKLCQNMPPEPPAHACSNAVKNAWNPVCRSAYQSKCLCSGVVLDQTKWVRECVEDACAIGKCRTPNGNEVNAPELKEIINECSEACENAKDNSHLE